MVKQVNPIALPFKQAKKFWADKVKLTSNEYKQLSDQAKARAFAVSGVAKTDEIETLFHSIQRAIDGGATFADFKKDCSAIAEKRGWDSFRLETIFRTNVQTAYMAGRYGQVQKTAGRRPYGKYSAVADPRTRPTHNALNQKVYRLGHPFWDTWWRPNGFRCRCDVITLSERQVKARGLTVETTDITGGLIEPVDPKTGHKMPARPLIPDNGFGQNPAKEYFGGIVDSAMATAANVSASASDGQMAMAGWATSADHGLNDLADLKAADLPSLDEPDNLSSATDGQTFEKRYGQETIITDPAGDPVIFSLRVIKKLKLANSHMIPAMAKNAIEIWLVAIIGKDKKIRLVKRYICLFNLDGHINRVLLETCRGVLVTAQKKSEKSLEKYRNGNLLFPKLKEN